MSEESKHTANTTAPAVRNDEPLSEEALALVAGGTEGGATPPVIQTVTHISVEITPTTPSASSLERG
jgi:hypothetical protein